MAENLPCSAATRRAGDRADELFPGPGLEIPSSDERDRADAVVGYTIARQHYGTMAYFANPATNRAFLRSHVRRHLGRGRAQHAIGAGGRR